MDDDKRLEDVAAPLITTAMKLIEAAGCDIALARHIWETAFEKAEKWPRKDRREFLEAIDFGTFPGEH
jgi:hypothetical protein